ncbi:MAG TPA: tRNA (adenosine(37)-N6)-dimethylallyltransferase MiaA [Gemmatimonadaceae bacterium]
MSSIAGSDADSLPVICGPTAAGKSALALRLAEEQGLAIISADSRQIYRGFDIGTAKPTREERARVPHFGIDVVAPHERYSAAAWAAAVPGWITEAQALGRRPLVVGGTGFYLRALFRPLFEEPPVAPERRQALAQWLERLSTDELRRWCQSLDPARASLGRTQLVRAVETALLTGHRISVLHRERSRAPHLTARYLVLDPGPALADAIARRVDGILAAGWLDEVRALTATVPPTAPAWSATGYDAMRRVVTGEWPLARAREAVIVATRQYAKRQRTWFRHQLPESATRMNPQAPDAMERLRAWWAGGA